MIQKHSSKIAMGYYIGLKRLGQFRLYVDDDVQQCHFVHEYCRTLASGARRRGDHRLVSGSFCAKESPPSIMVTRKPYWSFRDSKARDWLRKGKVLAPLVRHTCLVFGLSYNCYGVDVF